MTPARLEAQAAEVDRLEAQAAEVDRLRAEVERLRRLLSRNSGNSSMPPSTDDLPGRTKPARREKTPAGGKKRKRGKQPGAAGKNLPWLDDAEVVEHRPAGVCECGTDLAEAADEGVDAACQVTDVPLVTAKTTEHRMHRARCACGRPHVAAPPAGASTANIRVYGPNLRALVAYLLVFQHLPVHRCVQLIADLTGAAPSVGFVHGMLARCAAALADATKVIKTLVILAAVVHFDETTCPFTVSRTNHPYRQSGILSCRSTILPDLGYFSGQGVGETSRELHLAPSDQGADRRGILRSTRRLRTTTMPNDPPTDNGRNAPPPIFSPERAAQRAATRLSPQVGYRGRTDAPLSVKVGANAGGMSRGTRSRMSAQNG